ncbi:hypothetical protein ACFO0N_07535 [Halobium salinum]|uniref:Uncharacterized protein n=1 Tax=Halobium salinum TaxID=1364940 RepID=A0ABD5PAS2_9EURY|nr:hypothetical protein [Halobium salinum]
MTPEEAASGGGRDSSSSGSSTGSGSSDDGSDLSGTVLELIADQDAENAEYTFTVEGSVSPHTVSDKVAAEDADSITENGDGTVTVSGVSGAGYGDAFLVEGSITSMDLDASLWTVRYGGSEVDPNQFNESDSDSDSDSAEGVLELIADQDAENVEYTFTVEGSVSPHTASDKVAAEDEDSITENGDGTVTVSGVSGVGYGDAFFVEGTITSMDLDASLWTVRYGGSEVDPSQFNESDSDSAPAQQVLELIADLDARNVEYTFTVEGSVSPHTASDKVAAESEDSITENGDGTVTVSGVSGVGYGDAFLVEGSITSMDLDESDWTVRYGGSEVDPNQFGGSSSVPAEAELELIAGEDTRNEEYRFTVDGSVSPASLSDRIAAESSDTVTENGDGTVTVSGVSGAGYGDAFIVEGSITSMDLDETAWTVRYGGVEMRPQETVSA